jgi:hypothetical protein
MALRASCMMRKTEMLIEKKGNKPGTISRIMYSTDNPIIIKIV